MAETTNIITSIIAVLVVFIAIFSTALRRDFGDAVLFFVEISLFVVIIIIAIYGQKVSRT